MKPNRRLIPVVLASLVAGCVGAVASEVVIRPAYAANPSAPRCEQFCEQVDTSFRGDVTQKGNAELQARGARGWELIGLGNYGAQPVLVCFRRPAP